MMQTDATLDVQHSLSEIGNWFAANQVRLVTALVLVVVGVLLAVLLRALTQRLLAALERVVRGRGFRTPFAGIGRDWRVTDVIGAVVFWAVLLFFVGMAVHALGLPLLSGAVGTLSQFVPPMLAAVLILVVGLVLGNLARGAAVAAAARTGSALAPALGQVVRVTIIISAALIAATQLGVDITLLTAILSVALAAVLGGFAIAFGLGARTAMSNIIGSHYLRHTLELGQEVRVGPIEGTISALTPTSVVLQTADGRVIVPAKQFGEVPWVLLVKGGVS
jgi:small-conductance mechanosensitive channel